MHADRQVERRIALNALVVDERRILPADIFDRDTAEQPSVVIGPAATDLDGRARDRMPAAGRQIVVADRQVVADPRAQIFARDIDADAARRAVIDLGIDPVGALPPGIQRRIDQRAAAIDDRRQLAVSEIIMEPRHRCGQRCTDIAIAQLLRDRIFVLQRGRPRADQRTARIAVVERELVRRAEVRRDVGEQLLPVVDLVMHRRPRQRGEAVEADAVLRPGQVVAPAAQHVDALEPDIDRKTRGQRDMVGQERRLGHRHGPLVLIGEQPAVRGPDRLCAIPPAIGRCAVGADRGVGLDDAVGAVIEPQPRGQPVDAALDCQRVDRAHAALVAGIIAQHRRDPVDRTRQRDRIGERLDAEEIAGRAELRPIGRIAVAELQIAGAVERYPCAQRQMHRRRRIEVAERRAVQPPVIGVARAVPRIEVEIASLRAPFGERRAAIGRRVRVVERQRQARAVAVAPFAEQLGIDMLARVMAGTAPVVRARVRIRDEGPQPRLADPSAIEPDEAAPRRIGSDRQVNEPARRRTRIVEPERQRPARTAQRRRRDIDRALRQRDALQILGISELRGIGVIIANVVLRRALHRHADLVLPQPAQRQARTGRQTVRITRRDGRAGQEIDQLERVERRRLLGDERRGDRALGLGHRLVGEQPLGIEKTDDADIDRVGAVPRIRPRLRAGGGEGHHSSKCRCQRAACNTGRPARHQVKSKDHHGLASTPHGGTTDAPPALPTPVSTGSGSAGHGLQPTSQPRVSGPPGSAPSRRFGPPAIALLPVRPSAAPSRHTRDRII